MMKSERHIGKRTGAFALRAGILAAWATFALLLAGLPAFAGQPLSQGKVLHIDVRGLDLLLMSDPNLVLIDVRTPSELDGPLGRIAQARNVPMQELEKKPTQFPRDKTLVLICRSGHRSLKAADLLSEHGYVVYSVDGGMLAWRKLHEPRQAPEGASPKGPDAHGHTPAPKKPAPQEDKSTPVQDQFLDNKMGC